jgi:hypothetical protein
MSLRIYRAINIFIYVNASLHWVNNINCLFSSFLLITSGVQFALIKVDWLAACIALKLGICHFPPAKSLESPPANGTQGPIPEMSQTLLTSKKARKLRLHVSTHCQKLLS